MVALKEKLDGAGRWLARLYISTLALTILAFPFIFGVGFIFLAALVADALGLQHFGLLSLGLFAAFCFLSLLFFSVYAWPHISPVIAKVTDQLKE
jgi:hypothetical protein